MISSRDRFMIHVDKKALKENITSLKNKDFDTLRLNGRIGQKFDEILENEDILSSFNFKGMESSIFLLIIDHSMYVMEYFIQLIENAGNLSF